MGYPDAVRRPPAPRVQRGAALMVAIVMIFMMTVLGISAMRGATLEGRLASNALQKELTFQAAESSTDLVLARANVLENMICQDDRTIDVPEVNESAAQDTSTLVQDGGRTHPIGYELGGPISARRFVVTGSSALPDASTSTVIAQGVMLIGANDTTGGC